jgi:hypothetical protein
LQTLVSGFRRADNGTEGIERRNIKECQEEEFYGGREYGMLPLTVSLLITALLLQHKGYRPLDSKGRDRQSQAIDSCESRKN